MYIGGIHFGPVWGASGVQGFFGEGYSNHTLWRPFGLSFDDMTFVAKTTTLHANKGNMPLTERYTPQEWHPKCIIVKPFAGVVLNAVGLSGPGTRALLATNRWQARREPFFLSFSAIGQTPEDRIAEAITFAELITDERQNFRAPFGLQVNISCPNTPHSIQHVAEETESLLAALSTRLFDVPLVVKLSAITPIEIARDVASSSFCAGLCVSNTIPFGALPTYIPWERLFGSRAISPLMAYVGQPGGLSGAPLLPIVTNWVKRARDIGITKPINAGGGVLTIRGISRLRDAGASSCSIGSIAILRPWRVASLIRFAHAIQWST
ncbi:MAG: hypothetical protein AAB372_04330 [Patescibacteria group bacterium]|mgnify:CR=1 FL=1